MWESSDIDVDWSARWAPAVEVDLSFCVAGSAVGGALEVVTPPAGRDCLAFGGLDADVTGTGCSFMGTNSSHAIAFVKTNL